MILETLCESSRERASLLPRFPDEQNCRSRRSLAGAIMNASGHAVIAEIKYSSPSAGRICRDVDPTRIARDYIAGGCAAISVLTEPTRFGGSTEVLQEISGMSRVPVLRKDFIVDVRQLAETDALGADAVLLIARVLGDSLGSFVDTAIGLGLEPLVEVHSDEEAVLACGTNTRVIGINNRDLSTMEVDLAATRNLSGRIRRAGKLVVAESGIRTPEDLRSIRGYADAFLVGSAFMKASDRRAAVEGFVRV
jgi:indole-3-glycerol phosphate synthase